MPYEAAKTWELLIAAGLLPPQQAFGILNLKFSNHDEGEVVFAEDKIQKPRCTQSNHAESKKHHLTGRPAESRRAGLHFYV